MACHCGCGSLSAALPSRTSVEWKGFRSREVWERSQTSTACSSSSSSSSAYVASPEKSKVAAACFAQNASSSVKNDLSSTFWGSERVSRVFTSPGQPGRLTRAPASMPCVEARLFGPSIFNASKLRVLLPGKDADDKRPLEHPRIYTLTHSDITAKITLAVAREINKAQVMGWYSKLQRDEVVAEWRRTQGQTSLHVHCHISGSNFLHKLIAKLRFYIFQKELPLVLEAFMHGDRDLFEKHPELQNAPVWVYFHSNVEEYNRVECWGPLIEAAKGHVQTTEAGASNANLKLREVELNYIAGAVCLLPCECCSRHAAVIPIPESLSNILLQSQSLSKQQRID